VGIYCSAIVEQLAVLNFLFCIDKRALEFVVINKNSKKDKLRVGSRTSVNSGPDVLSVHSVTEEKKDNQLKSKSSENLEDILLEKNNV